MDTSTSKGLVSAGDYLLGSMKLEPRQILQADWKVVLDDVYAGLKPRIKYTALRNSWDLTTPGRGIPWSCGIGTAILDVEHSKLGTDKRVLPICHLPRHSGYAGSQSLLINWLVASTNGQLFEIYAAHDLVLHEPYTYVFSSLQIKPVSFADLPLTSPSALVVVDLGGYILWRLVELSKSIVAERDEKTAPFRAIVERGHEIMRKVPSLDSLIKQQS